MRVFVSPQASSICVSLVQKVRRVVVLSRIFKTDHISQSPDDWYGSRLSCNNMLSIVFLPERCTPWSARLAIFVALHLLSFEVVEHSSWISLVSWPPASITRYPSNTRRWANVVLMLGQRRRRWPNIKTTLAQRHVFAGISSTVGVVRTVSQVGTKSAHDVLWQWYFNPQDIPLDPCNSNSEQPHRLGIARKHWKQTEKGWVKCSVTCNVTIQLPVIAKYSIMAH